MNLFSDIYNCYYQVMKKILSQQCAFSKKDLNCCIKENGFEESPLFIMPKILSGEWDFFEEDNGIFISKLSDGFSIPLSKLQKCYISALLLDEKIQLFFNKKQLDYLKNFLHVTIHYGHKKISIIMTVLQIKMILTALFI